MRTKTVSIADTTYTIAPLNYEQYEATFFDENLKPLERAKVGDVVRYALENSKSEGNPPFADIPAADVIELWSEVLSISRLTKGEAKAPETQE